MDGILSQEEISALYDKYVMETYARANLLFVR